MDKRIENALEAAEKIIFSELVDPSHYCLVYLRYEHREVSIEEARELIGDLTSKELRVFDLDRKKGPNSKVLSPRRFFFGLPDHDLEAYRAQKVA